MISRVIAALSSRAASGTTGRARSYYASAPRTTMISAAGLPRIAISSSTTLNAQSVPDKILLSRDLDQLESAPLKLKIVNALQNQKNEETDSYRVDMTQLENTNSHLPEDLKAIFSENAAQRTSENVGHLHSTKMLILVTPSANMF